MIERDYIMRIVREVAQMLARVISKRVAEDFEEAERDLEKICRQHIGLELGLVRSISPDDVLDMLRQGGALYAGRSMALAEILLEDANLREATGRGMETIPNYVHAFKLIQETMGAADEELKEELSHKLSDVGARLSELGLADFVAAESG